MKTAKSRTPATVQLTKLGAIADQTVLVPTARIRSVRDDLRFRTLDLTGDEQMRVSETLAQIAKLMMEASA